VAEDAEEAVVAGVEAPLRVVQELPADLQRVVALDPGDLVVELIRAVERVGIARAGADRREAAVQRQLAQPGNRLAAGDAERRVRVADAGPGWRAGDGVGLAAGDEPFVDERVGEDATA